MFRLEDLADIIANRATATPDTSWTAKLMASGTERIAKKFGEEAIEAVIAAVQGDKAMLTAEAADVLYQLLVLLQARGVTLGDVMRELEQRTTQSGLAEKAARGSNQTT